MKIHSSFPTLSSYLKSTYGDGGKDFFRNYQKYGELLAIIPIKTKFLRRCLNSQIVPDIASLSKKGNRYIDRIIRRSEELIIRSMIEQNSDFLRKLRLWSYNTQKKMKARFLTKDYFWTLDFVQRHCFRKREIENIRLDKKFLWLKRTRSPRIEQRTENPDMPGAEVPRQKIGKIIHNFSDHVLSIDEENLLEKGLKFAVTPKNIPAFDIQAACENFGRKLHSRQNALWKKEQKLLEARKQNLPPPDGLEERIPVFPLRADSAYFPIPFNKNLQKCLHSFGQQVTSLIRKASKPKSNLTREQCDALKSLRADEDIVILPADKGNAVVLLNKTDYSRMMENDILSDQSKFIPIASDPTRVYESDFQVFLLESVKKKGLIEDRMYWYLRPSDARTPRLYGLVKIHKDPLKLRPIVSAIRSFNYNIGKFLVWILQPYIEICSSYVKNSQHFISIISQKKPGKSRQISLDVSSLFTNVPVLEAVNLAMDLITRDNESRNTFPAEILRKFFEFATTCSCFVFNGQFYKQVDGFSMGSPLAPTMSHLFMVKIESIALQRGLFRPYDLLRYVDDIYLRIPQSEFRKSDKSLEEINKIHPSIQFTIEKEKNDTLNYLEVSCRADLDSQSYSTSVYRKPTHTNLYIRWDSAHPASQKLGIFKTLLCRAKKICSELDVYNMEKENLVSIFVEHGFPKRRLLDIIRKFENRTDSGSREKDMKSFTALALPYIPGFSERLSRIWRNCARDFKVEGTTVIYRPVRKLSSFLSKLYDPDPAGRGVYHAVCNHRGPGEETCFVDYIGETKLYLESRKKSHFASKGSALSKHCEATGHSKEDFEFSLLCRAPTANLRFIKESLLIRERTPALNDTSGVNPYVFV